MGFFDIFKKKQEIRINNEESKNKLIKIEEIENYLDSIYKNKINSINSDLFQIKSEYTGEIKKLEENLQKLMVAEIKNKAIPPRAIQMTLSNRENYVNNIYSFISQNNILENYEKINLFIIKFEKSIEDLSKSSVKSHNIMQEIYLNETNAVLLNIKNLDKFVLKLKNLLNDNKINQIDILNEKHKKFIKELEKRENLDKILKEKNSFLKNNIEEIKIIEKNLIKLENSSEYLDFKKNSQLIIEIDQEINQKESYIKNLFSQIEPALKKLSNMDENNQEIKEYLQNSIHAIKNDPNFKILIYIGKIKNLIIEYKIDFKNDKRKRILIELEKINYELLNNFDINMKDLNKNLDILREKMKNLKIIELINNCNKDLENLKLTNVQYEKEIQKMKKDFNYTLIDEMKNDIESNINNVIEDKIKIL